MNLKTVSILMISFLSFLFSQEECIETQCGQMLQKGFSCEEIIYYFLKYLSIEDYIFFLMYSILLMEDGVYAALKNTDFEKTLLDGQKTYKFYVLGPDLKARGLDIKSLIPNIEIVDYKGFVKLTVENKNVQNWL